MGISSVNFSSKELSCSCCGKNEFNKETLVALQRLRDAIGKPIKFANNITATNMKVQHIAVQNIIVKLVPQEKKAHILQVKQ